VNHESGDMPSILDQRQRDERADIQRVESREHFVIERLVRRDVGNDERTAGCQPRGKALAEFGRAVPADHTR
jgi:hypothetical protein